MIERTKKNRSVENIYISANTISMHIFEKKNNINKAKYNNKSRRID